MAVEDERQDVDSQKAERLVFPETPEDVMKVWRDKIKSLPDIDIHDVTKRLCQMQSVHIPTELLLPEGYISLFGQLQHLRQEALAIVSLVTRHHKTRKAAISSMQSIYQGMSTRKSVGEREAEAENWLIYVKRNFIDIECLYDHAKDVLEGINRAASDAVQQLKSINQFGIPSGLLDASQAVQITTIWDDESETDNSEEE